MKKLLYVFAFIGMAIVAAAIFVNYALPSDRKINTLITARESEENRNEKQDVSGSDDLKASDDVLMPAVTLYPATDPTVTPSAAAPDATDTPIPTQKPQKEKTAVFAHVGRNNSKHFFVADSPYNDVDEVGFHTVININNRLSSDYVPKELAAVRDFVDTDIVTLSFDSVQGDKTAVKAFAAMMQAAYDDGVTGYYLRNVYRSYNTQIKLWNKRLRQDPSYGRRKGTPLGSAYPGSSEHQTGFAFDITCLSSKEASSAFRRTENYKWLRNNSYKYGFVLRYDHDKTDITGIKYEPYHYRYVGKKLAKKLYESNLSLEEYYNCPVVYE